MEHVLTSIAESIRLTGSIAAVQVVVADPPAEAARLMGSAGFAPDPAFFGTLRECRARGARLATFDGPATLDQRVLVDRRDRMLSDGAWSPMHGYLTQIEWRDYVATPIPLSRERGGVINCYLAADAEVTDRMLAFLRAMASVAASAIEPASVAPWGAWMEHGRGRLGTLTARERDVLGLLAEGGSNRDIALRLGISERTAGTHVSNILTKLDLASRTQAALLARTQIPMEE